MSRRGQAASSRRSLNRPRFLLHFELGFEIFDLESDVRNETMINSDMLAFASAIFCGALALIVVWNVRRSVARWAFVLGMAALAAEEVFFALTADAATPDEMVYWQNWNLAAKSFLPGFWLLFSITYAR